MKQYHQLLQDIKDTGTLKPAARAGMPGTISRFGYQFRHSLKDGFPAPTTKKLYWKGVVVELLWFLRGDTNIKFLDQFGVRKMWHQDAYNFYKKIALENENRNEIYRDNQDGTFSLFTFDEFCEIIKNKDREDLPKIEHYTLGDCGYQYGKLWRNWETIDYWMNGSRPMPIHTITDQIKTVLTGLKETPEGRRHILTAIDPAHDTRLALYWCHALAQWNCRPLTFKERRDLAYDYAEKHNLFPLAIDAYGHKGIPEYMKVIDDTGWNIPKYHLDCQMYQRSADSFLGVPLNIASYALLTHIFSEVCNMIPGDMIYTYGDLHIYEDHMDAVNLQLSRTPKELPKLRINTEFWNQDPDTHTISVEQFLATIETEGVKALIEDFQLDGYDPDPTISANLSTGLQLQK
mgnify:CR=1 FL=1